MTAAEYRAARVAAGLTQRQAAEAIGVAPNTIARRERGERPVTPEAAAALLYAITGQRHTVVERRKVAAIEHPEPPG